MSRTELDTQPEGSGRARVDPLRALAASGAGGLEKLLAMRASPSWAQRRDVIAALAALGDVALGPLCTSLVNERSDEKVIAATVDALAASTGNADAMVSALSGESDPAVLADVANILGRRRNREYVPVLARLSAHDNDNVAVAAIEALGRVGGRAVIDLLVAAVESRRFFRTFAAIDVLAKSGDPRAIAPIVALLDTAHYALEAVRALGHTSNRAAVAPLARLLSSPAEGHVRIAAVALHELHGSYRERFGTIAPIEEALRQAAPSGAARRLTQCWEGADTNEQVAILVVLGCLGSEAAMPLLIRALDGAPALASAAADVLTRLASDTGDELIAAVRAGGSAHRLVLLPAVSQSRASEAVAECLHDADPRVRRLACETLARLGDSAAVPALFAALGDNNAGVVQAATAAIIALAGAGTGERAARAALSPSPVVRRAALRILACIGHPGSAELLESGARDSDARVRDAAIQGMPLLDAETGIRLLTSLVESSTSGVRVAALRALGDTMPESSVVAALRNAVSDPDPWARYYACQSLGKLREVASAPIITPLIEDPAGQVRVAAIEALSRLSGEDAFAALRTAAASPDLDLRRAALIGLGLSKRDEAVPILMPHALSEDEATRLITLSALAGLDAVESLPALSRAAHDSADAVRTAAIGLLAQIGTTDATRVLCLLSSEPLTRDLARAALATPTPRRVAGILSVLRHADDELALELSRGLARLNQPDATAALFEALTFANSSARKAAATTLGAIGRREALSALQQLAATDSDPEVRRVAALLIAQ